MKQLYYALKSKDDNIRRNSSSGGVFRHLAEKIIEDHGIVYGAIYDKKFNVIHSRISEKKELYKISGSKYAKSNLKNCFELVKKDLEDGKEVLFSGTPCQIKALKNVVPKTNKLLLVDIVCHGTPDSVFLEEYIKWLEKK